MIMWHPYILPIQVLSPSSNPYLLQDCDWAVHPGGKAVINVFHSEDLELNLSKEDLSPSWESLKHHGNLAAPSILLVIKAAMERTAVTEKDKVFCIGFGPGMVIKYYGLTRKE